ncbi:hypothetical protein MnTg02_02597 [bacterium MnTg02]|nr:hypothetical protein MnTg02_02597 [bacterium MnTg02]
MAVPALPLGGTFWRNGLSYCFIGSISLSFPRSWALSPPPYTYKRPSGIRGSRLYSSIIDLGGTLRNGSNNSEIAGGFRVPS